MKDEIKEILDYFKRFATIRDYSMLTNIEDYITSLEQENERLERDLVDNKKAIKLFTNNSANMLEQALDYKSRIDLFVSNRESVKDTMVEVII